MWWNAADDGGFSDGQPWLPVHPDPRCNVADQRGDENSMLQLVRTLIELRRKAFGGKVAEYTEVSVDENLWVFRSGQLTVSANFGDQPVSIECASVPILSSHPDRRVDELAGPAPKIDLYPWEAVVEDGSGVAK